VCRTGRALEERPVDTGWEEFEDEQPEKVGGAAVGNVCTGEGTESVKEGGSGNGNVGEGGEDGKKGGSGNGDFAKAGRIVGFAGVR